MGITQQEEGLMIIKDYAGLWVILIGILFVVVGLVIIFSPQFFEQSPPWWVGLIFASLGFFSVFFGKNMTLIIDKNNKKILIHQKGLIKTLSNNYGFEEIKEIRIRKEIIQTNREVRKMFSLIFVLRDGQEILFSNISSSYRSKRKIAEKIAGFMDIPLHEDFTPSIRDISDVAQKMIEKNKGF